MVSTDKAGGFDGPINEIMWSRMGPGLGHPSHVKDYRECQATYSGTGHTLQMSAGWVHGFGSAVYMEAQSVSFTPPGAGSRWDTLVQVKDATPQYNAATDTAGGTCAWEIIQGTSSRSAMPGPNTPGGRQSAGGYLVEVTPSGLGVRERIQAFSGTNLYVDSVAGLPSPAHGAGVGTRVFTRTGEEYLLSPNPQSGLTEWRQLQGFTSDTIRVTRSNFGLPDIGYDPNLSSSSASMAAKLANELLKDQRHSGSYTISVPAAAANRPFVATIQPSLYFSGPAGATVTVSIAGSDGGVPKYVYWDAWGYQQVTPNQVSRASWNGAPVSFQVKVSTSGAAQFVDTQTLSGLYWTSTSI